MGAKLWIDGHEYAAKVLRGGVEPWSQPEEIARFCGESVALLGADRWFLPLEPLVMLHWPTQASDSLTNAESFDDMIADGALTDVIGTVAGMLGQTGLLDKIVPVLPGVSRLLGDVEDDEACDIVWTALGDVVRAFSQSVPATIAVDEVESDALAEANSLFRIAEHMACPIALVGGAESGQAALCFPAQQGELGAGSCALLNAEALIAGSRHTQDALNLRVEIDRNSQPELVLKHLERLTE